MEFKKVRKKIDLIDDKILELLNERIKIALEIGDLKRKNGKPFFVPEREKEIIERLIKNNKGPISSEVVKDIFQEIFNLCRNSQEKLKIAYLGPEATFTHLAAIKSFGKTAQLIPVKSITDVFTEVEKKRAHYGVVPIENSTEGVVNHTLDMFIDSNLKISAELMMEIEHNLISRKGIIKNIKKIYSHSQAIAQCRNWIEENVPQAELIEVSSTSTAAKLAYKTSDAAAIASEQAASLYNLKIAAKNIGDRAENLTRFLVIGDRYPAPSGKDKTSILFSIKDHVGALHKMLIPFQKNGINLTKIESRPSGKKVWQYIFFVDFMGHVEEPKVKSALKLLEEQSLFVKILGSYPQGD